MATFMSEKLPSWRFEYDFKKTLAFYSYPSEFIFVEMLFRHRQTKLK